MRKLLLVAALGACATPAKTTSLAELASTQLEVVARGQINIELHVDETAGCPQLDERTLATFDNARMMVSRGGYDTNASGCYPIAFWFDQLPTDTVNGFERQAAGSELVVADPSATWTVDTTRLFGNDFTNDTATGTITWQDVTTISSAEIAPVTAYTISGNQILYPAGEAITFVDARAHPQPTRCDGPSVCTVDLEGTATWGVQP